MVTEMLDIYDENEKSIGVESYEEVHKKGDWHKVVGLFIINSKNQILMQKRSLKKIISPGLLTVSVGGHLRMGEDVYACMKREAYEEIGLNLNVLPAKLLYACKDSKVAKDKKDNVFLAGYTIHCEVDMSALKFDRDEIEEFEYIHYLDLNRMFYAGVKFGINKDVMIALFKYMDKYVNP